MKSLLTLAVLLAASTASLAADPSRRPPQAPELESRLQEIEARLSALEIRNAPGLPPFRSAAPAPVFTDDLPTASPFAAPVCVGGNCKSSASYSVRQSSGTGWYPGKLLGR
jgi:hypothetical protein